MSIPSGNACQPMHGHLRLVMLMVIAIIAMPLLQAATIFQADFNGDSTGTGGATDIVTLGGTGAYVNGTAGNTCGSTSTTPTLGGGNYLRSNVTVSGNAKNITFTPTTAGAWSNLSYVDAGTNQRVLRGGFDFFYRPNQTVDVGSFFRPLDVQQGSGLRLIVCNNGSRIEVDLLTSAGSKSIITNYVLTGGKVHHIGVTFSGNATTGVNTIKVFAREGYGTLPTNSNQYLIGQGQLNIDETTVTAGFTGGTWKFGDHYAGGTGGYPKTNDFDCIRIYDADPNVFAGNTACYPDTTAPSAPTNLTSLATGDTFVTLSWTGSTDDKLVDGYYIYNNNVAVGSTAGTTFTVDNLTANTLNSFTVKAVDPAGNLSGISNTLLITTQASRSSMPFIFNVNESVKPNKVVSIQGDNFGSNPEVWLDYIDGSEISLTPTVKCTVLNKSDDCVTARIPLSVPYGLYAVWVKKDGTTLSNYVFVNQARGTTVEFAEIAPNCSFRIFGRNLALPNFTPAVRFVDTTTGASYAATVTDSDTYILTVTAPEEITADTPYAVYVSNGSGALWGDTKIDDSVVGCNDGVDAWNLGVPWAADFATTLYDVKTDARLTQHAVGDGVTNDRPAIQAAIDYVNTHGGGVVYLPAGSYKILYNTGETGLVMKSNVVLQGESRDSTIIYVGCNAITSGYGMTFPQRTTLSGMMDLTYECLLSSGTAAGIRCYGPCSKLVFKNIHLNGKQNAGLETAGINHLLISDCIQDTKGTQEIGELSGTSYYIIRNNTYNIYDGRFELSDAAGGGNHGVIENNTFICDATGQVTGNGKEFGGVEFSGVTDLAILNNTFTLINGPRLNENDGETILSQYCNPGGQTLGTVTSATATTLTDSTKTWESPMVSNVIVITEGPGAGQWRGIKQIVGSTIIVDRPWDIVPTSASIYAVTGWTTSQNTYTCENLIMGNTLNNQKRGIWLYGSSNDMAIVGNTLNSSEGIYVRCDNRPNDNRYNLAWNVSVVNNNVSNDNGIVVSYIGVSGEYVHNTLTDIWGTGALGIEFRGNSLKAQTPNLTKISGNAIDREGYWVHFHDDNPASLPTVNEPAQDNTTKGILGTVFEDNTAIDTNTAFYTGTGVYQTVISNMTLTNVTNYMTDATGNGCTHASVDTVSCVGTSLPGIFKADYNGTGTGTGGSNDLVAYGGTGRVVAGTGTNAITVPISSTMGAGLHLRDYAAGTGTLAKLTFTPAALANSWGAIFSNASGQWLVNGGMDFFVRSNITSPVGDTIRPLDVTNGTNGIRMTFTNTNSTTIRYEVLTATGGGGTTLYATYPMTGNTIHHIAVLFKTDPATGLTTMKIFARPGTEGFPDTSVTTVGQGYLVAMTTFNLVESITTNTTGYLSGGTWDFSDCRSSGAPKTNDYDSLRLYNDMPACIPALDF